MNVFIYPGSCSYISISYTYLRELKAEAATGTVL